MGIVCELDFKCQADFKGVGVYVIFVCKVFLWIFFHDL